MTAPASAAFKTRVLALVAQIPAGRVMTYGQLALLAGQVGAARQVGYLMNGLLEKHDLPWQRVINAQGAVSTDKLGFGDIQRGLLKAEGIEFSTAGKCDLGKYQWWPESDAPTQERLF
ncbi:MGMT family protein [Deinococcus detaillensis]|uniref:MGMT family protein n=1 Tax=Deinococcus detaillensis TaxID=2592048 RepID=A0A553V3N7_9DEIO|nr:MGMT family protein [Deinococcus detaillensis]TSA87108.1 MGMT family protein [Deinococcus detaillensis]